jgi:hypothetical protein
LIGVAVAVPYGLAIVWIARRVLPRAWIARLDEGAAPKRGLVQASASIAIGTLSHLATDFVSHGRFVMLWPWCVKERPFPEWWYTEWASIPLPGYRKPYPFAPHTVVWLALSACGIWLFVRCLRSRGVSGGAPR